MRAAVRHFAVAAASPAAESREPSDDEKLLLSYIPATLVHRFAAHPVRPEEPWQEDFPGAVAFIDVSGFTALSEKLKNAVGRRGAELLNQYMNSYFEELIMAVAKTGGDVIKFAGDALQVVWRDLAEPKPEAVSPGVRRAAWRSLVTPAAQPSRWLAAVDYHKSQQTSTSALTDEQKLSRLVLRAVRCCMKLLNDLNDFSPVDGVRLTLHVGIGAGTLSSFCVGGKGGRWEYFVAGEPIEQMAVATDLAASGQLALSGEARGLLVETATPETASPALGAATPPPNLRRKPTPVWAEAARVEPTGTPEGLAQEAADVLRLGVPIGEGGLLLNCRPRTAFRAATGRASTMTNRARRARVGPPEDDETEMTPYNRKQLESGLKSLSVKRALDSVRFVTTLNAAVKDGGSPPHRRSLVSRVGMLGLGVAHHNRVSDSDLPGALLAKPRRKSLLTGVFSFVASRKSSRESRVSVATGAAAAEDSTGYNYGHLAPAVLHALRAFVPALIDERLQAGQAGLWVSEHRVITTVFLKLLGLGAKPCEPAELSSTHRAVRAVQEAFNRRGGAVLRLITDDKGTRFLVAFGLPGQQNEDDVSRAVSAAIEAAGKLTQIPAPRVVVEAWKAEAAKKAAAEEAAAEVAASEAAARVAEAAAAAPPYAKPSPKSRLHSFSSRVGPSQETCRRSSRELTQQELDAKGARTPSPPTPSLPRRAVAEPPTTMRCAIGITTGRVFCGEAGCDIRREYTLMGSAVNMAARLMQAAEKQGRAILVDEETFLSVSQTARPFERLEPILVKGRDAPLPIFSPVTARASSLELAGLLESRPKASASAETEVLDANGSAQDSSPDSLSGEGAAEGAQQPGRGPGRVSRIAVGATLGRAAEKAALQSALDRLEAGHGGALILLGEAGMGKTQMTQVLSTLHDDSFPILRIQGVADVEAGELATWRPVFRRLLCDATTHELAHVSEACYPSGGVSDERSASRSSTEGSTSRLTRPAPNAKAPAPNAKAVKKNRSANSTASAPPVPQPGPAPPRVPGAPPLSEPSAPPSPPPSPPLSARASLPPGPSPPHSHRLSLDGAAACDRSSHAQRSPPPTQSGSRVAFELASPEQAGGWPAEAEASQSSAVGAGSTRAIAAGQEKLGDSGRAGSPKNPLAHHASFLGASLGTSRREMQPQEGNEQALATMYTGGSFQMMQPWKLSQVAPEPSQPAPAPSPSGQQRQARFSAAGRDEVACRRTPEQKAAERAARASGRWRRAHASIQAWRLPLRTVVARGLSIRPAADPRLLADRTVFSLAPLLTSVLPTPLPANGVTRKLTGAQRQAATLKVMTRVLSLKLGGAPAVLVIEDADQMGALSWALLAMAIAEVPSLLVVLLLQPHTARHDGARAVEKSERCRTIRLAGLGQGHIGTLVARTLGGGTVPPRLAELIHSRCDGNPLYAMELARSLRYDHNITLDEGGAYVLCVPEEQIVLPSTIEGLIISRIDRLPADQQLWLKLSSVLGDHFTTAALAELSLSLPSFARQSHSRSAMKRALAGLVAVDMLRELVCSTRGDYRHTHGTVHAAAYLLLPAELKTTLHTAAAQYYDDFVAGARDAVLRADQEAGRAAAATEARGRWGTVRAQLPKKNELGEFGAAAVRDVGNFGETGRRSMNSLSAKKLLALGETELARKARRHWVRAAEEGGGAMAVQHAVRHLTMAVDLELGAQSVQRPDLNQPSIAQVLAMASSGAHFLSHTSSERGSERNSGYSPDGTVTDWGEMSVVAEQTWFVSRRSSSAHEDPGESSAARGASGGSAHVRASGGSGLHDHRDMTSNALEMSSVMVRLLVSAKAPPLLVGPARRRLGQALLQLGMEERAREELQAAVSALGGGLVTQHEGLRLQRLLAQEWLARAADVLFCSRPPVGPEGPVDARALVRLELANALLLIAEVEQGRRRVAQLAALQALWHAMRLPSLQPALTQAHVVLALLASRSGRWRTARTFSHRASKVGHKLRASEASFGDGRRARVRVSPDP